MRSTHFEEADHGEIAGRVKIIKASVRGSRKSSKAAAKSSPKRKAK